jgi:hypothetical protein
MKFLTTSGLRVGVWLLASVCSAYSAPLGNYSSHSILTTPAAIEITDDTGKHLRFRAYGNDMIRVQASELATFSPDNRYQMVEHHNHGGALSILDPNSSGRVIVLAAPLSGSGSLNLDGSEGNGGVVRLVVGNPAYTGNWIIPNVANRQATLQVGAGETSGSLGIGTLTVNNAVTLSGGSTFQLNTAFTTAHDRLNNLEELAFGSDPAKGTSDGRLAGKFATVNGSDAFTFTLPARNGAVFTSGAPATSAAIDGLIYQVQADTGLEAWTIPVEVIPGPDATAIHSSPPALPPGYTYQSFHIVAPPNSPDAFARVRISGVGE